ncbi:hypothetical protein IV203_028448 [Nitzschia inconspicua]|uniref:Uncharacterized protein n=1 Tax=Nitzschia inconspicua TaxID=303405 RepID=A0A9K3LPW1_9STRA|nr:hypothetical protein IV203_028448 [Nitzschia inconspicua]
MPFFRNPFTRSSSGRTAASQEPLTDSDEDDVTQTIPVTTKKPLAVGATTSSKPLSSSSTSKTNNPNNRSSRWSFGRSNRRASTPNATLFCWFCDMRIATILLNVLHMIFSLLLELFEMVHRFYVSEPPLLCLMAIIFSGLGVVGALHFNLTAMFVSTLGLIGLLVLYLSEDHMIGLVLLATIFYCHIFFICEMKKGIMTPQNYDQHRYMDEMGEEVLQRAHSYASDVGETTKEVVQDLTRTASNAMSITSTKSARSARQDRRDEPEQRC